MYIFKLDNFEGPLDLLIHLIEKSKVEIVDISITDIANQYIAYVNEMKKMDMDVAVEFLLMASTLLKIKSEYLLPSKVEPIQLGFEEIDIEQELIQKLVEYKKYKDIASILRSKYKSQKSFYRNYPLFINEFKSKTYIFKQIPLKKLTNAYKRIIPQKEIHHSIIFKPINVEEKIRLIKSALSYKSKLSFFSLISNCSGSNEIIAYFLAILDLIKKNKLYALQAKNFDDILLQGVDNDG